MKGFSTSFSIPMPDGGTSIDAFVRHSDRAAHIAIRIHGSPLFVELVVPKGRSAAEARMFAESRMPWIVRTIQKIQIQIGEKETVEPRFVLPSHYDFPLIGKRYEVEKNPDLRKGSAEIYVNHSEQKILVMGDFTGGRILSGMILRCFQKPAENYLIPRMEQLAAQNGFRPFHIRVHAMKSRWGSCSAATGRITLNTLLLFFTPDVADYVMYHELCHKYEMNHSPQFYRHLSVLCPGWKERENKLKKTSAKIPYFLF